MSDALSAAVRRALADSAQGASLHMTYSRGHGLSGITQIELGGDGRYAIASDETRGRDRVTFSGLLDERDREVILQSLLDNDVIATRSSTRNLADDEVPVLLALRSGGAALELRIWDDDARQLPNFHAFEIALLALVRKLSNGAITTSAD